MLQPELSEQSDYAKDRSGAYVCAKPGFLFLRFVLLFNLWTFVVAEEANRNTSGRHGAHSDTVIWTGQGDGTSWKDGGNWSTGKQPGPADTARFVNPPCQTVVITDTTTVGRLECEFPSPTDFMKVDGSGKLVVTGVDSGIIGKPTSLRAMEGILEIGADLEVEVLVTRVYAYDGGTLVISSPRVFAGEYELKLGISQTGTIRINTPYWEPGIHLDVATSRTWGLGPHVFEFAMPADVPQGITFPSFKEHDADPFHITGFEEGDYLRFEEDPLLSMDPEKELVLKEVKFVGWPDEGAAEIVRQDDFWYLLPKGSVIPNTQLHDDQRRMIASKLPDRSFPAAGIANRWVSEITRPFQGTGPSTSADVALIQGNRLLVAYSQPSENAFPAEGDSVKLFGVVSDDSGANWTPPFPIIEPSSACHQILAPSLLRDNTGELILFANCRDGSGKSWIGMSRCLDEAHITEARSAWTPLERITPEKHYPIGSNSRGLRTRSGRLLLPVATSLTFEGADRSPRDIRSQCLYSDDNGASWQTSRSLWKGPAHGLLAPTVAERSDSSLFMLNQTSTHRQYRSHSLDGGDTWSAPTEVTRLISPNAPAVMKRDPTTGWLVVVWNRNSNRIKDLRSRQNLSICFSNDDGRSWFGDIALESDPSQRKTWSNPSLTFVDGRTYVTYYERTATTEEGERYTLKLTSFKIRIEDDR